MTNVTALRDAIDDIVEVAYAGLHPSVQPHYGVVAPAVTRRYLRELAALVVAGVEQHEAVDVVRHAEQIATARYRAGYRLSEVQAAFNAVEQAMWALVVQDHDQDSVLTTLALLSSVIGAGKDALARTWVDLTSRRQHLSVDVFALSEGTER
jgi:hypothetical protein